MTNNQLSRRRFLAGIGGVGAAAVLGGCATSSSSSSSSGGSIALVLQSSLSDAAPKAALTKVVEGYTEHKVTLNTVASETFRTQLPTYLTSANPPDVYTWYAGSVADAYANKDLLLDVSDVWQGRACASYSDALQAAVHRHASGKKIFVPTNYYWWGMFYRKSNFAKWGVQTAEDLGRVPRAVRDAQEQGRRADRHRRRATPRGSPPAGSTTSTSGSTARTFHRELLAGKHRFDDPKVKHGLRPAGTRLLPYFDPKGTVVPVPGRRPPRCCRARPACILIGTFFADAAPKDALDDIDFFQFPIIDPTVPVAEEAPTDGYFASAKTKNPDGVKELLRYLATAEAQEIYVKSSLRHRDCPRTRTPRPPSPRWCRRAASSRERDRASPSSSTATPATRCSRPPTPR